MLLRDKFSYLVSKLLISYLDGGICLAIVDLKDWRIDLMVSRRSVVSIAPEVKYEDRQPIPFLDSHELRAAFDRVNSVDRA
jgi:hypothetical protein